MKDYVQDLKNSQTKYEKKLWYALRGRRFCNYKFRRQRLIGSYIVDFVCLQKKLIIELDGSQHLDNKIYDEKRTLYLNSLGFKVLRFWNNQILFEFYDVLNAIYFALIE